MNTTQHFDNLRNAFSQLKAALPSKAQLLLATGVDMDIENAVNKSLGDPVTIKGGRYTDGKTLVLGGSSDTPSPTRVSIGLSENLNVQWPHRDSLLQYLAILATLPIEEMEKEAESMTYKHMGAAIKRELWVDGKIDQGFADLLDHSGYCVSYQPAAVAGGQGTLMLELTSKTYLRWHV